MGCVATTGKFGPNALRRPTLRLSLIAIQITKQQTADPTVAPIVIPITVLRPVLLATRGAMIGIGGEIFIGVGVGAGAGTTIDSQFQPWLVVACEQFNMSNTPGCNGAGGNLGDAAMRTGVIGAGPSAAADGGGGLGVSSSSVEDGEGGAY